MKISAQNVLKGTIKSIDRAQLQAEVTVDIGGQEVTAIVSNKALDMLEAKEGGVIFTVFDASHVSLGVSHHKRGE